MAPDVDPDDRLIADESAQAVLEQLVTDAPDRSLIRRGLATLRGVVSSALGSATTAAGSEAGKALITALTLGASQQ